MGFDGQINRGENYNWHINRHRAFQCASDRKILTALTCDENDEITMIKLQHAKIFICIWSAYAYAYN